MDAWVWIVLGALLAFCAVDALLSAASVRVRIVPRLAGPSKGADETGLAPRGAAREFNVRRS